MEKKIFFTSDHHFGHYNIIKYCKRPFTSVEEMNEALINNWNAKIGENDDVYVVGDFALCPPYQAEKIFNRLKGNKFLIRGNHDKNRDTQKLFIWCRDMHEMRVPDGDRTQSITLCHYGMRVWNKRHHGAWQLYGHSHGNLPDDPKLLSIDVGVDPNGYSPLSYEEVKQKMLSKNPDKGIIDY